MPRTRAAINPAVQILDCLRPQFSLVFITFSSYAIDQKLMPFELLTAF
jgi:hypothetical protein